MNLDALSRKRSFFLGSLLFLILVSGALFRVYLFRAGGFTFDSDQAIAGIGALRILREGTLLLMTPGQNYNGEFLSFYFLPWHLLFKPSVGLLRLGMLPLTLLMLLTTFFAVRIMSRSTLWALVAMTLMTFPASMVMDWYMRSSPTYVMVLIGLNLGIILLLTLIERIREKGWSNRNIVRGIALGFTLGFCYWCQVSMLVVIALLILFIVLSPKALLRLTGFTSGTPKVEASPGLQVVSHLLQLFLLIDLTVLTGLLLSGGRDVSLGLLRIGLNHLGNPILITVILLTARIAFTLQFFRSSLRGHLGMMSCVVGLWVGALPLIWYIWGQGHMAMGYGDKFVGDVATFKEQVLSVFNTGIPILLGYYHNWKLEVQGVPLYIRKFVLLIHYAALLLILVWAIRLLGKRETPSRPIILIPMLFVLQILFLGVSTFGKFIEEPRYILPLHWVFSASVGGMVYLLVRVARTYLSARIRIVCMMLALFIPLFLIVVNVKSCLDVVSHQTTGLIDEKFADEELLDFLRAEKLTRVSCRFSPHYGYWMAYKFTYLADEEIILAPADRADGMYIRSRRYQHEVDNAEELAYLLFGSEAEKMKEFLQERNAGFEEKVLGRYAVFYELRPDILHSMTQGEYLAHLKRK